MITEYTAQSIVQQQERELTRTLERRRLAAERAVNAHGGDRLALIAHLARESRASRATGPKATGGARLHPAG